jgi:hypothetical protein
MIEFYPDLKNILITNGFKNSSELFTYLRKLGAEFAYDRSTISSNVDMHTVIDAYKCYEPDGFLFDCESIYDDSVQLEVIFLSFIDKQTLLKLIKLRAFS